MICILIYHWLSVSRKWINHSRFVLMIYSLYRLTSSQWYIKQQITTSANLFLNWWYKTLTRENNLFLNVLMRSNFATPTPFGSVSCFVLGVELSNYYLISVLIHQASYSKGYQSYLMHMEVLGSIWKICRYPIKLSEVLLTLLTETQLPLLFEFDLSETLHNVISWPEDVRVFKTLSYFFYTYSFVN